MCGQDGDLEEALIFESRFADALILARDPLFLEITDHTPSVFVRRILAKAECPVILAPKKNIPVDEIVFCYDGNVASMHAIKQFTYLFPEYRNKKVTLLEVRNFAIDATDRSNWLLQHARTQAWVQAHYAQAVMCFSQGEAAEEL